MTKSKDLWILVQDSNRSESKRKVTLSIHESENVSRGKRIELELMDEEDPFFFYSLTLSDADFITLKTQQGLLVDFTAFPGMIFQLVDKCILESSKDSPQFTGVLSLASSHEVSLEFKEINAFRHLTHLSLLVNRGSDSQIKDFLGTRIQKLQSSCDARVGVLKGRLSQIEEELRRKTQEAQEYRIKNERLLTEAVEVQASYSSSLAKELAQERDRSGGLAKDLASKYDEERRALMENHGSSTRILENRVAALEYENKDLTEKKHRHESTIHRLNEELRFLQDKADKFMSELEDKKKENNNLDAGYHDKERLNHQLKLKVGLLETEKERAETDFRQQSDLYAIAKEQKRKLEEDLRDKSALVAKRENAVRSVTQELMKANEIIKKFQEQARNQFKKVQLGSNVVQEQERLLSEKEKELESARKSLQSLSESQRSLQAKHEELSGESSLKESRIGELEKVVKTNETVIHWLNKQLTSAQARDPGLRLGPAPDGTGFSLMASSTPLVEGSSSKTAARQKDSLARRLAVSVGSPILEEEDQKRTKKKNNKENFPDSLDPKYFQSSLSQTPKSGLHHHPKDASVDSGSGGSTIKRRGGGLLRKSRQSDTTTKSTTSGSVYFPSAK